MLKQTFVCHFISVLFVQAFKNENYLKAVITYLLPVPALHNYTPTTLDPSRKKHPCLIYPIIHDHAVRTPPALSALRPQRSHTTSRRKRRVFDYARALGGAAGGNSFERVVDQRNCTIECTERAVIACRRTN
jgi:hypothetical protein